MRITYKLPPIARGQSRAVFTAAVDTGLRAHRDTFLPLHFTPAAISRYPVAYRTACPKRGQQAAKAAESNAQITAMLNGMTTQQRQDWRRRRKDKAAARKALDQAQPLRSLDPTNQIPLVDTGRLRTAVLSGQVQFIGRPEIRRMKMFPPFYTYIKTKPKKTAGDWFDKVAAVQEIIPAEEQAFAKTFEAQLQNAFNQ